MGQSEWVVYRRYNEFLQLYKTVCIYFKFSSYVIIHKLNSLQLQKKKLLSDVSLSFPPKRTFKNNFDQEFLQSRLEALDTVMEQLCDVTTIFQEETLQAFITPNRVGDIANSKLTQSK